MTSQVNRITAKSGTSTAAPPAVPSKGSRYRCVRIGHKMDPLISEAAGMIGLSRESLFRLLPSELTLWVDPFEVSCRIGEKGSVCGL